MKSNSPAAQSSTTEPNPNTTQAKQIRAIVPIEDQRPNSTGIILTSDLTKIQNEQARANVIVEEQSSQPAMPDFVPKVYLDPTTKLIMQTPAINLANGETHEKAELEKQALSCVPNKALQDLISNFLSKHSELHEQGFVYSAKKRDELLNKQLKDAVKKGELKQFNQLITIHHEAIDETMAKTENGQTLMHIACQHNQEKMISRLCELKFTFNCQDQEGNTPLHILIMVGDVDLVKYALAQGAKIEIKNKQGFTALHWALEQAKFNVFEYLLKQKADCSTVNNKGETLLHTAIKHGSKPMLTLLLAQGFTNTVENDQGQTPTAYARACGNKELARWLNQQFIQRQILKHRLFVDQTMTMFALFKVVKQQKERIEALGISVNPLISFENKQVLSLAKINRRLNKQVAATALRLHRPIKPFTSDSNNLAKQSQILFKHEKRYPEPEGGGKAVDVACSLAKVTTNIIARSVQWIKRERDFYYDRNLIRKTRFYEAEGKLYIYNQPKAKLFTISLYRVRLESYSYEIPANAYQQVSILGISDSYYMISIKDSQETRWQAGNYQTQQKPLLSGNEVIQAALIINNRYLVLANKNTSLLLYDFTNSQEKPVQLGSFSEHVKLIKLDETHFCCAYAHNNHSSSTAIIIDIYSQSNFKLVKSIKSDINNTNRHGIENFHIGIVNDSLFLLSSQMLKQYSTKSLNVVRTVKPGNIIDTHTSNMSLAQIGESANSWLICQGYLYVGFYDAGWSWSVSPRLQLLIRIHLLSGEIVAVDKQTAFESIIGITHHTNQGINVYSEVEGAAVKVDKLPDNKLSTAVTVKLPFRQHFQQQLTREVNAKEKTLQLSLKPMSWSQASTVFNQFVEALKQLLGEGFFMATFNESKQSVLITCLDESIYKSVNDFITLLCLTKADQCREMQQELMQLGNRMEANRESYQQLGITTPSSFSFFQTSQSITKPSTPSVTSRPNITDTNYEPQEQETKQNNIY